MERENYFENKKIGKGIFAILLPPPTPKNGRILQQKVSGGIPFMRQFEVREFSYDLEVDF